MPEEIASSRLIERSDETHNPKPESAGESISFLRHLQ